MITAGEDDYSSKFLFHMDKYPYKQIQNPLLIFKAFHFECGMLANDLRIEDNGDNEFLIAVLFSVNADV